MPFWGERSDKQQQMLSTLLSCLILRKPLFSFYTNSKAGMVTSNVCALRYPAARIMSLQNSQAIFFSLCTDMSCNDVGLQLYGHPITTFCSWMLISLRCSHINYTHFYGFLISIVIDSLCTYMPCNDVGFQWFSYCVTGCIYTCVVHISIIHNFMAS